MLFPLPYTQRTIALTLCLLLHCLPCQLGKLPICSTWAVITLWKGNRILDNMHIIRQSIRSALEWVQTIRSALASRISSRMRQLFLASANHILWTMSQNTCPFLRNTTLTQESLHLQIIFQLLVYPLIHAHLLVSLYWAVQDQRCMPKLVQWHMAIFLPHQCHKSINNLDIQQDRDRDVVT